MIIKTGLWLILVLQSTVTAYNDTADNMYDAELVNATQTSTDSGWPASNAIDGDWDTDSHTEWDNGTHWWRASLTKPMTVHQVELRAGSYGNITVDLYKGEELTGQCGNHSGYTSRYTLECTQDVPWSVDTVMLTMTSTQETDLRVYEVLVRGTKITTPTKAPTNAPSTRRRRRSGYPTTAPNGTTKAPTNAPSTSRRRRRTSSTTAPKVVTTPSFFNSGTTLTASVLMLTAFLAWLAF